MDARRAGAALVVDRREAGWVERLLAATDGRGVARFAVGQSGWFAIDHGKTLWKGEHRTHATRRIAEDVIDACIGDSADYYVTRDGTLHVHGLAHRGQYGDGRLTASAGFTVERRQLLDRVIAVAAGDTATIARTADGALWQWDGSAVARRLSLP